MGKKYSSTKGAKLYEGIGELPHEDRFREDRIIFKVESYNIIGAAIEVHRVLGCGFYEAVYQEAFEPELTSRGIPFQSQKPIEVFYKDQKLQKEYIPDLICFGKVIVELKALDSLTSLEESQILNYLKATGHQLGLLVNFGSRTKLEWKRFVK